MARIKKGREMMSNANEKIIEQAASFRESLAA